MQWFDNLRLRTKLLSSFALVIALIGLLGGFSVWQLARVNDKSAEIAENWLPSVEAVGVMWAKTAEIRATQYRHITVTADADMDEAEAILAQKRDELDKVHSKYLLHVSSPEEKAISDEFSRRWNAYWGRWEAIRTLSRANRNEEASAVMRGEAYVAFNEMNQQLQALVKLNHAGGAAASAESSKVYASARVIVVLVVGLACLLAVGIALLIARRITTAVNRIGATARSLQENCIISSRHAMEALVRGDTTVKGRAGTSPMRSTARDELGDLSRTFDRMITDMHALLAAFAESQDKVEALVHESASVAEAAQRGELDRRGDTSRYEGSFRRLVEALNATLDAVAAPIDESEHVLERVAARDLSVRMTGEYRGKYLAIKTAVNTAVEKLDATLTQVNAAADRVASAGTEITSAAQSLASGSSEQAASLEQVSASVHMFASMAQQSASNAGEARSLAASARIDTAEGTVRMQRLTEAVVEIRQSSAETAKIIKTIDEIAFQTNLLALNAAVEAARAGDAGRGFAVVAEEVRSLALRAAEAARTTSGLIEQGQRSADRGVTLNSEVMDSLTRINAQIEQVAEVTHEISAAAQQQVDGVAQITSAVDQINTVTQQAAANAEQSASAATELEGQAQTLRETVAKFTLSPSASSGDTAYRRPNTVGARRPRTAHRSRAVLAAQPAAAGAGAGSRAATMIPFDDNPDGVLDAF